MLKNMISQSEIEMLTHRDATPGSPVLSVYLNVDQSQAGNVNRGFDIALRNMLRSFEQQLKDKRRQGEFAADAEQALDYVANHKPGAPGLAIFCDESEGFLWSRELKAAICNEVHWNEAPYVRPLLELLDEFERYGVILLDRAHARLFTVFMGEIEEHGELLAPANVRRIKTTGTDHLWSQMHFQRRANEHERWYLREVAETVDRLAGTYAFDRLVLAGAAEVTGELQQLLPKRLQSRVVASVNLPTNALEAQVVEAALKIEQEVERTHEMKVVDELIAAAARNQRAVVGLSPTLSQLQEGRISRLVYGERWTAQGWRCGNCAALFAEPASSCVYCGSTIQPIPDLAENLVAQVAGSGGKLKQVHGEAAARLRAAGGIGANLRF